MFETRAYQNHYYLPQIGDEVVYFHQGHEKFFQSHDCFFYCGNQKQMSSTDLPWMKIPGLKSKPAGQVRCHVVSVSNKFPSVKATHLIDSYGASSSEAVQAHTVITYVELEILDAIPQSSRVNRFIAPIWPSQCYQYIIPKSIYDYKLHLFQ